MSLNNGKSSQQTNSPAIGFPTGSYKSYKSFLRQYSKPEQDLPSTTKITSSGVCNGNANNVKNMVSVFNKNSNSNSTMANSSQAKTSRANVANFNDLKCASNLNQLLSMSSEEIQMLNKDVLEKFLKILTEYEENKSENNNSKENGKLDLNNNKIYAKFTSTLTNDITDDDIEKQKQNLIDSLKLKLEKYRQLNQ